MIPAFRSNIGDIVIKLIEKLPRELCVAVSGGVDSMTAMHFLSNYHDITALHFIHSDSDNSYVESEFVKEQCDLYNIKLIIKEQDSSLQRGQSKEAHWRAGRYSWFKTFSIPVVIAHTLDDAVETYLFGCVHGVPRIMDYTHANCVRPFLTTRKEKLIDYAVRHGVSWVHDVTNDDCGFAIRNHIRHKVVPEALVVNPGLFKVVKRLIDEKHHRGN